MMLKNNQSFCQRKEVPPFDWNHFLNQEIITEEMWYNALYLSGEWVSCACGNLCDIIPRVEDDDELDISYGAPKDGLLRSLGYNFHNAIENRDLQLAKKILNKIEIRSTELINSIIQDIK